MAVEPAVRDPLQLREFGPPHRLGRVSASSRARTHFAVAAAEMVPEVARRPGFRSDTSEERRSAADRPCADRLPALRAAYPQLRRGERSDPAGDRGNPRYGADARAWARGDA